MSGADQQSRTETVGLTSHPSLPPSHTSHLIRRRLHIQHHQPSDPAHPPLIIINGSHLTSSFYPQFASVCVSIYKPKGKQTKEKEREKKKKSCVVLLCRPADNYGRLSGSLHFYKLTHHSHLLSWVLFHFH